VRWIVFDDETAEAVVSRWRRGAAEILHENPVDTVLRMGGPSIVVMPSHAPGQVLIARFSAHALEMPPSFEPSFAKSDLVSPPVEGAPRKPWWRKLVA
jgi:hypothetical protein